MMSQLRKGQSVRRAILLELKHHVRVRLARISGVPACFLENYKTGEIVSEGRGNTEDEAFKDAYNKFQATPKTEDVAAENEALRQRINDLESGLSSEPGEVSTPPTSSDPKADAPGTSSDATPVKKKRKKKTPKPRPAHKPANSLSLPNIDDPAKFPEAKDPQITG